MVTDMPLPINDQVLSKLELVRLKLHQVIHEAGETIKSGYFVNAGVISVLAVQPDGKSVEVGLIGKEGFVGLPLLVGYRSSPTRLITQGDGTAYRCDADVLRRRTIGQVDLDEPRSDTRRQPSANPGIPGDDAGNASLKCDCGCGCIAKGRTDFLHTG